MAHIHGAGTDVQILITCAITLCCFLSIIQYGASPLYMACQEGHDNVVQLLLDGGARIDLPAKVYM